MRSIWLAALLASVAIAPIARADTFQFSFRGDFVPDPVADPLGAGPTLALSWQISGLPTSIIYDGEYPGYEYLSVPITSSAVVFFGDPNLSIAPEENPREVDFFTHNGSLYDTYGIAFITTEQPFTTGLDSNPVFLPGSYAANFLFASYSDYDGTLAITDLNTVTPEPSTFALLGTGLMSLAGVVRRKVHP